jgi:hypothetical protein
LYSIVLDSMTTRAQSAISETMPNMNFEDWKTRLLVDADRSGHRCAVGRTKDHTLHLFWREGAPPTLFGLLHHTDSDSKANTFSSGSA